MKAALSCAGPREAQGPTRLAKHMFNRVAWAQALAAAQGPEAPARSVAVEWAEPALCFYLAYRDGTGDVERTLGAHKSFAANHAGAGVWQRKTKSFATTEDSAEVSLEIWADGPKAESEIADKPGSPGTPRCC